MHRIIHWLVSEKGIATLEYFGTLLVAPEILAVVFGERAAKKVADFLNNVSNRLNPASARAVASWLTLNPIAAISFIVASAAGIAAIVFEIRDPNVWKTLDSNSPFFVWLMKSAYVLFFKPVFCFGAAVGIWITRSKPAQDKFDAFMERHNTTVHEAQMKRDLFQQITIAIAYSVILLGFSLGFVLGGLLLTILFHMLEKPLRAVSYLSVEKRFRRLISIAGFAMITTAFLIRVVS